MQKINAHRRRICFASQSSISNRSVLLTEARTSGAASRLIRDGFFTPGSRSHFLSAKSWPCDDFARYAGGLEK
jgi:hypothetical protein